MTRSLWQRLSLGPLLVLLSAGLSGCPEKAAAPPPPPVDVKVADVLVRDVPVMIEAIGETRGNTEIEIRARVEGFIETVDYKEGSLVEKGQLLYTIDAQPFQAALAQAKASQAESEAELARARQDVARYEPLVAKNAVSREEYETAVALEKAAAAAVEASKAVVEQAEIDLSYTKVVAPEAGLAGRTEVYAGTLVGRGLSTLLTHISRMDPIHVRISFAEREYLEYARKNVGGAGGNKEKEGSPFELLLADGSVHPDHGKLVFVDRSVDPMTGTIMAEVAFPNPSLIVRPGQYARVRAAVDQRKGAILVPQRAILEVQGVFNVVALGKDNTVEQRIVTPAERIGGLWVITSGLQAGDRILVEGLQKVRPGAKVNPQVVAIEEQANKPSEEKPPAVAPGAKAKEQQAASK